MAIGNFEYDQVETSADNIEKYYRTMEDIFTATKNHMNSLNSSYEGGSAKQLQDQFNNLASSFEDFSRKIHEYALFLYQTVEKYKGKNELLTKKIDDLAQIVNPM